MEQQKQPEFFVQDIFALIQQPEIIEYRARNLAIAVIQDAFCRLLYLKTGSKTQKMVALEAKEWFFSNNETWPFSFRNLCFMLNISPSAMLVPVRNRIAGKEDIAYRRRKDQHGQPNKYEIIQ